MSGEITLIRVILIIARYSNMYLWLSMYYINSMCFVSASVQNGGAKLISNKIRKFLPPAGGAAFLAAPVCAAVCPVESVIVYGKRGSMPDN
ncbi:MAG: hypothetical protein PHV39_04225 [Methanomicrobium sp.]|nr:hypothetical protein [Methanomicrobium sp.]